MKYMLTALLSLSLATTTGFAQAKVFKAGAATSNITPPLGLPIVGGFVPYPATHIHDELHARCLVLDDGKTKLALVICDLLSFDRVVSDEARALIQKDVGIPPENVLISATHTHSACSALGKRDRVVGQPADEYQRFVALRIADGVKRANNLLRPAQIGFGSAMAPEHVFNRRWFMKPGTVPVNPFGSKEDKVKMNPPRANPNLTEPAGPTDPEVRFIAVREPNGKPIAVYTSYSLHYVGGVGPGHVSADYFGMYCEALTRLLNVERQSPAFVAMLTNGTSGDINNINFRIPGEKKQPYEQMRYVAEDVAAKVHKALANVSYRDHVTLGARYREPLIATRHPTPELLAWAKETLATSPAPPSKGGEKKNSPPLKKGGQGGSRTDLPGIYAERTLRMAEHPDQLKIPLQVLRIGDAVIGTMPVEIFVEIGLEFKKRSPLQPAWLVCLAHGSYGYLPTPKHHALGGYETWLGTNRLEVGASDKMLGALLEMVVELK